MLTLRTCSLTFLGLLTGFVAAAQSTVPHAGPSSTTVLSWVVWWAAGVVLLMAILTAGSVTSAAQHRFEAQEAEPAAVAAVVAPNSLAPAAVILVAETAPIEVSIATQEEVFA